MKLTRRKAKAYFAQGAPHFHVHVPFATYLSWARVTREMHAARPSGQYTCVPVHTANGGEDGATATAGMGTGDAALTAFVATGTLRGGTCTTGASFGGAGFGATALGTIGGSSTTRGFTTSRTTAFTGAGDATFDACTGADGEGR